MRRKDREVTDSAKIREVIENSEIIRIGYYDSGEVYIVPVNYGFEEKDSAYTFYFHGASAGRKYELSRDGCSVGFELESSAEVVINDDTACRSTCLFHSIIGTGEVSLITDADEKKRALNIIMKHFTGEDSHTFEEKFFNMAAVYKLKAEKLSCKEKQLKGRQRRR